MQDPTPERGDAETGTYASGAPASRGTLKHLDDLDDHEVAEGEPDIRGWTVRSSVGRDIGEVDDLLVDLDAMKVRYMAVELDKDELGEVEVRHVLIPIGTARLNDDDDVVIVSRIASDFTGLPTYWRGALTADFERALLAEHGALPRDETEFFGARRGARTEERYIVPRERR